MLKLGSNCLTSFRGHHDGFLELIQNQLHEPRSALKLARSTLDVLLGRVAFAHHLEGFGARSVGVPASIAHRRSNTSCFSSWSLVSVLLKILNQLVVELLLVLASALDLS